MMTESIKGIRILCCYTQKDEILLLELAKHMSVLRRQHLITVWNECQIEPAKEAQEVVLDQLNQADIILLLVSPDFMTSDFCSSAEMKRVLARHRTNDASALLLIMRPVSLDVWKDVLFENLEALPLGGKAVTDWPDSDEAFCTIAEALYNIISKHLSKQWYNQGNALYGHKQYEGALAAFEQAIVRDPTNATAYAGKGHALYYLKCYEEALVAYEQAIQLDPSYVRAYDGKGNVLSDLKRYEEALAAYEQAIQLDPSYARAYNGKGNALYYLKHYEEALAAYEQAIQLGLSYAAPYSNKGLILNALKRYEEALAAYEQAIQLDPSYARAYNGKGNALSDLKRYEEALVAYKQAIQLDPTNEEILTSLFRASELNPSSVELQSEIVGYCLRLGRHNEAAKYQGLIARHYFETHQVKETLMALQQLITIDHTNYEAYDMLGQTYQSIGEYEQASRVYRNLAKINPGSSLAHERLATLQELRTHGDLLTIENTPSSTFREDHSRKTP